MILYYFTTSNYVSFGLFGLRDWEKKPLWMFLRTTVLFVQWYAKISAGKNTSWFIVQNGIRSKGFIYNHNKASRLIKLSDEVWQYRSLLCFSTMDSVAPKHQHTAIFISPFHSTNTHLLSYPNSTRSSSRDVHKTQPSGVWGCVTWPLSPSFYKYQMHLE